MPINKPGLKDLWDRRVLNLPEGIALFYEDRRYSFRQLDQMAGGLAIYLSGKGIGDGARIPLCMERRLEMIIALLAIIKLGAIYVPVDPEYPQERINYILEDIDGNFVLTDRNFPASLTEVSFDEPVSADPDRITCILYTSGSTGKPKGVQVTEAGILNRLEWMWDEYPFEKGETVAWKTSLSFVDHVWEIFGALLHGVPSVLLSRYDVLDPDLLIEKLSFYRITRWVLVPSLLRSLLQRVKEGDGALSHLRLWTSSGELLPPALVSEFYASFPPDRHKLLNIYGSTEVTADVTCYDTSLDPRPGTPRIPIGKPIANCRVYILDESGRESFDGHTGEIAVGGIQVADGYWNRPELTAEKFVSDPEGNGRMYKTGDIGRRMPDGNIEYLGRVDQQVKIRGFRVELGEIETALRESGLVQQVVVLAREDVSGNRRLTGYYTGVADREEILTRLRARLPEYMVPLTWMKMEEMPLTVNGKIDKLSLPDADVGGQSAHPYSPPRNEVEKKLAALWEEILGHIRPGINDNFFELGGDSIMAMRLITSIRRALHVEMTVRVLFENPTIAGLAAFVGLSVAQQQQSLAIRMRCIIPSGRSGSKMPFFAMPDRMTWDKLGLQLPNTQPLYCLEMLPEAGIEENARHFIREIKAVQPHGPYTLGGHCGGGLIALEMGRQLMAMGERMHLLVLFESYGPDAVLSWTSPRYWMGKVKLYHGVMSNLSLRKKIVFPFQEIKRIYRGDGEFDKEYKSALKPYPGNVLLFRATIQDTFYHRDDPMMGWKGHIQGRIDSVQVEGDHLTIVHQSPGIEQIARKLKEVL